MIIALILAVLLSAVDTSYSPHPDTITEIQESVALLGTPVECSDATRYVVCIDSTWPPEYIQELSTSYLLHRDSWEVGSPWQVYPSGETSISLFHDKRNERLGIIILTSGRVYYLVWVK